MSDKKKEFRIMLKLKSEPADVQLIFTSFLVPDAMVYPKGHLEKAIEDFRKTEAGKDIAVDKKGKFKWSDALKKLPAEFVAEYGFETFNTGDEFAQNLGTRETAYIEE